MESNFGYIVIYSFSSWTPWIHSECIDSKHYGLVIFPKIYPQYWGSGQEQLELARLYPLNVVFRAIFKPASVNFQRSIL